ncbi:MAG: nuclear transport factor 2 family protein [Myxococcales bacterium]|nr:nuclear transport factor 2 family protein [Myxococcales bacterium]
MDKQAQADLEEIRQLKARYFRLMDTKQWAEWQHCFTDDIKATYDGPPRLSKDQDPNQFSFDGKKALLEGVAGLLDESVLSIHQGFMPELELTSDTTAKGIWAMHDYLRLPKCSFHGYGHYHEEYAKEDGSWKIRRIHLTRLHVEETWQGI